jgi:hypothetical protein
MSAHSIAADRASQNVTKDGSAQRAVGPRTVRCTRVPDFDTT